MKSRGLAIYTPFPIQIPRHNCCNQARPLSFCLSVSLLTKRSSQGTEPYTLAALCDRDTCLKSQWKRDPHGSLQKSALTLRNKPFLQFWVSPSRYIPSSLKLGFMHCRYTTRDSLKSICRDRLEEMATYLPSKVFDPSSQTSLAVETVSLNAFVRDLYYRR